MFRKIASSSFLRTKIVLYTSSNDLITQTTEDKHVVEHFAKLSSIWWDEMGALKGLHSMNTMRIPFVKDALINQGITKKEFTHTSQPLKGLRILDVGCGGGLLSEPLARLGPEVVGIDPTGELIEIAKEHAARDKSLTNLTYEAVSVEEFSIGNREELDVVVSSEVVEHVNDQPKFVAECVKCLRPGGSIIITTISKTYLAWAMAIIGGEYIFRFIPCGTHEYKKLIKPQVLRRLLEENNCHVKIVRGMLYNYFTNSWSWTNNTSIFYILHALKKAA